MQLALKTHVTLSPIQAIRSKLNQNSTRFACSHFPVLPKGYNYVFAGSSDWYRGLSATFVTGQHLIWFWWIYKQ